MKTILGIVIIAAIVAVGPLLIVWSMNTLFGLGIQYGLKEWIAVFILTSIFAPKTSVKVQQ